MMSTAKTTTEMNRLQQLDEETRIDSHAEAIAAARGGRRAGSYSNFNCNGAPSDCDVAVKI